MAEKKEQKAAGPKKKVKKIYKYSAGKNCPKCGSGHKLADHKKTKTTKKTAGKTTTKKKSA